MKGGRLIQTRPTHQIMDKAGFSHTTYRKRSKIRQGRLQSSWSMCRSKPKGKGGGKLPQPIHSEYHYVDHIGQERESGGGIGLGNVRANKFEQGARVLPAAVLGKGLLELQKGR